MENFLFFSMSTSLPVTELWNYRFFWGKTWEFSKNIFFWEICRTKILLFLHCCWFVATYPLNTFCLIWEMWAEKRPNEWLGRVLGVLRLAPSTHISQIKQKVFKGYRPIITKKKYISIKIGETKVCLLRFELLNFRFKN
jgi:hypothetical protein